MREKKNIYIDVSALVSAFYQERVSLGQNRYVYINELVRMPSGPCWLLLDLH